MVTTDEDEPYRAVERELTVLFRRGRAAAAEVAREVHGDLGSAAYGLLVRIADADGARGVDLSSFFGLDKATISRQVQLLERLELVRREPDPLDGRAHRLVPTDSGRRRLAAVRRARGDLLRQRLGGWDRADVVALGRLLGRFNSLPG